MFAAFLLSLTCQDIPASADNPAYQRCTQYEIQAWEGPTPEELESCAVMAESLTRMDHPTTCELSPMAEVEEQPQVAPPKPKKAKAAPASYRLDQWYGARYTF